MEGNGEDLITSTTNNKHAGTKGVPVAMASTRGRVG